MKGLIPEDVKVNLSENSLLRRMDDGNTRSVINDMKRVVSAKISKSISEKKTDLLEKMRL